MKRIVMTMLAAALMTSAAFAQDQKEGKRPEKKFDKTEMVKHRTDEIVKKYSLNGKQASLLLALNEKYADKMGPGARGHRHGRPGMKPGRPERNAEAAESDAKPAKRPELTDEQKAEMKAQREEHEKVRKAYDAELQKIMTAEQFQQYKTDMSKQRRGGGPDGSRGTRGGKDKK